MGPRIVIVLSPDDLNADSPIEVTPAGTVSVVSFVQDKKQLFPIEVTPLGITGFTNSRHPAKV